MMGPWGMQPGMVMRMLFAMMDGDSDGTVPVRDGLVASLNRPGGNVTGATQLNVEVGPKRLGLAHELIPAARVIALLVNPTNPLTEPILNGSQAAARILGLQLQVLHTSNAGHFDAAFMPRCECATDAPVVASADPLFGSRAEQLGAFRYFSKEGREVEHPQKPKKEHKQHSNEGVQSVRADQNSRNGCLCHAARSPHQ